MKQRNLIRLFPRSPFLARIKFWTEERNIAEIDGPYDEVPGELLLMIASRPHAQGADLKAMKACMDALKKNLRSKRTGS